MCEPISIGTGLAIAGTAVGAAGVATQYSAQKKQEKAQKQAVETDLKEQYSAATAQQAEEQTAAAQDISLAHRQASAALGTATASAGESGVTGSSVDALLHNIERQRGEYVSTATANLSDAMSQLNRVKKGQLSLADARMRAVQGPNPFASGLQIAGIGLNAYTNWRATQPPAQQPAPRIPTSNNG